MHRRLGQVVSRASIRLTHNPSIPLELSSAGARHRRSDQRIEGHAVLRAIVGSSRHDESEMQRIRNSEDRVEAIGWTAGHGEIHIESVAWLEAMRIGGAH